MRVIWLYLAVVTIISLAAGVNVLPGNVYEVNVSVSRPLELNTSWVGIIGNVSADGVGRKWDYYVGPLGVADVPPPPPESVGVATFTLYNTLSVPSYAYPGGFWYALLSKHDDVNVYNLFGTCDKNVDALEGNYCDFCLPSKTFTGEENITLNGKAVCLRYALLENGKKAYLVWDGNDFAYLSPLPTDGNFYFLASIPAATRLYLYLLRSSPVCGDRVCDPGEEGNCADCYNIVLSVSPESADVNVGAQALFSISVQNNGPLDANILLKLEPQNVGEDAYTYTLSPTSLSLAVGESGSAALSITPKIAGTLEFLLRAYVGETPVASKEIIVRAKSPTAEEEEGAAGGGAAPPPEEENMEAIPLATGGYWISALGCISYIQITGPDRVNAYLEENLNIPLGLQNAGTCDENVRITVEGLPEDWFDVSPTSVSLPSGEGTEVTLHVVPKKPGVYQVKVTARGYTGSYHIFRLFVAAERAPEAVACQHEVLIVAPEEIRIVEGEEVNNILVSNLGTCREPVSIVLKKGVAEMEVVLDRKEFYLSAGERYKYDLPKLAPGEYVLTLSAGPTSKTSKIYVSPAPVLGGLEETLVRIRWALLVILFLVLIGAIGYVRYRYLR